MMKKLKELTKKPEIFQRSESKFWNDAYIAKQMLKNHLATGDDRATRKLDTVKQSIQWIKKVAPPNQQTRLLDLGCGPGIYGELFQKAGYQVKGVDISENSIQFAQHSAHTKKLNIQYEVKDYINDEIEGNYDLITLIYCDYGALVPQEQSVLLRKIYNLLDKKGKFIFDVFTPEYYQEKPEFKTWSVNKNSFWREEEHLLLQAFHRYDEQQAFLNQYIVITEDNVTNYHIWEQVFTIKTLQTVLEIVGFKNIAFYNNMKGESITDTSETLCIVAEK